MFNDFFKPYTFVQNGFLVRRAGIFYKEKIRLSEVYCVIAKAKDALTHDEMIIIFSDKRGPRVWLSEFDRNYSGVMKYLESELLGIKPFDEIINSQPFSDAEKVLWQKSGRPKTRDTHRTNIA